MALLVTERRLFVSFAVGVCAPILALEYTDATAVSGLCNETF
jgi:hypothetical protein